MIDLDDLTQLLRLAVLVALVTFCVNFLRFHKSSSKLNNLKKGEHQVLGVLLEFVSSIGPDFSNSGKVITGAASMLYVSTELALFVALDSLVENWIS